MQHAPYPPTIDHALLFEFFKSFSRFECALKSTKYLKSTGNNAEASAAWDKFGREMNAIFYDRIDDDVATFVKYILTNPPKKQVVVDGRLGWHDDADESTKETLERVLVLVRRVRNNLFHGGKYVGGPVREASRDTSLIQGCIEIIEHCVQLDDHLKSEYNRTDWLES